MVIEISKHNLPIEDLAAMFKALSDPNRLAILQLIREECGTECRVEDEAAANCVGAIAERFDLSLSTVSHHLKELRNAGLIDCHKRGRWVYCTLNTGALRAIESFLGGTQGGEMSPSKTTTESSQDTAGAAGHAPEKIVDEVRKRYAEIAEGAVDGCCGPGQDCSPSGAKAELSREIGYGEPELNVVSAEANLGLGCGAPIRHLGLTEGEVLLDLGSGPGFDALLAAPLVGEAGKVIGVDMTPEMIERARKTLARSGHRQVEFRQGRLESLPVEDASVDAVTSNCVINLVPDKAAVFAEVARVLRPGGRMVVSDIVVEGELPEQVRNDLAAWAGCVAGALTRRHYLGLIEGAGLGQVEVLEEFSYPVELGSSALAEQAGCCAPDLKELAGLVRSVTIRAYKPRG